MRRALACLALLASGCSLWFGDPRNSASTDLAGADLAGADLAGADLADIDLAQPMGDLAGMRWTMQTSQTTANLRGLWGCSSTDVHVVGVGVMLHLESGAWTKVTSPGSGATFNAVSGNNCSNVYAAGMGGLIYYSNGNDVWTQQNSMTAQDLWGMWGSRTSLALVASGAGAIETSTGGGAWAVATPTTGRTVVEGVGATVWLVGTGGQAFVSTDSGATFKAKNVPKFGTIDLYGLWISSDAQTVMVVGDGGNIWRSTNGGNSFKSQSSPTTNRLRSIWSPDGTEVFAVGDAGIILHSTDGGTSWLAENSQVSSDLWKVWGTATNNVFAVGDGGVILRR